MSFTEAFDGKDRRIYAETWPDYCRNCEGSGLTYYTELHTEIDSPEQEEVTEWCPSCLSKGFCPRCGVWVFTEESWDSDELVVCPNCAWREMDARDRMPPLMFYDYDGLPISTVYKLNRALAGEETEETPDDEKTRRKYTCPRCGSVDVGDVTILDHNECRECHRARLLGENNDADNEELTGD